MEFAYSCSHGLGDVFVNLPSKNVTERHVLTPVSFLFRHVQI